MLTLDQYIQKKHGFASDSDRGAIEFEINNIDGAPGAHLYINVSEHLETALKRQCGQVWDLVDEQLAAWNGVETETKAKRVATLVLTGGLSSNKYLKERLEQKIGNRPIHIRVPVDPELSVSQGLVWDALETIRGNGLFRYRSLECFGVVVGAPMDGNEPTKMLLKGDVVSNKFRMEKTVEIPKEDEGVEVRFVCSNTNDMANIDDLNTVTPLVWKVSTPLFTCT